MKESLNQNLSGDSLWKHQIQAIELAKTLPDLALFMSPGVGKTRCLVEILRNHFNNYKRIMKVFVFCPVIVVDNWKREILKYSKIPESHIHCLTGSIKKRVEKINEGKSGIYITNYDAFVSDEFFLAVRKFMPEILVLDEAHRVKNIQAKRTKKLVQISQDMEDRKNKGEPIFRYLLTGSPILNGQMDIFSQFLILDGGKTFGKNFYAFRGSYFYDKNAGMPKHRHFPDWRPIPARQDELALKIGNKSINAKKEDCLDLPPFIRQEIYVEMSKEQKKAYEEMKKDFITYLDDKACVAQLAITKALRMQQVLSGFLKMEDGSVYTFDENPRIDALKELLSDIAPYHKIIVWSVYKENYKHIAKACEDLKLKYVELHGETSSKDRVSFVDAFNKDDSVRVLIGNPKAAGLGVNLVSSSYSIYYNRNFSLEDDIQSEARNYRGGSEIHDKVVRIDIICKGTLDEVILTSLKEKSDIAAKILNIRHLL